MKARSWKIAFVAVALAGGVIVSVLGAMIAAGVYNVAATAEHLYVTDKLIAFALDRSISVRSASLQAPDLDDDTLVRLGAEHFRSGCAPCHGDPQQRQNPIVERMYPAPPSLRHRVSDWTSEELFWIVKHGIKFTGMPAWPGEGRDDEIWPVVAYLNQMDDEHTKDPGYIEDDERPSIDLADIGNENAGSCARCHGDDGAPPISDIVPELRGQNGDYLRRALLEYRDGTRASGIMAPIAAAMAPDEIENLARGYASTAQPQRADVDPASKVAARRGRDIAQVGVPTRGIPPCLTCHSGQASAAFPSLAGLSARYIRGQLQLWRQGLRDQTTYGAIMAPIARRLTPEQIEAVSNYLSNLDGSGSRAGNRDAELMLR